VHPGRLHLGRPSGDLFTQPPRFTPVVSNRQPLDPRRSAWRIEYLEDSGGELQPVDGLHRKRSGQGLSLRLVGLRKEVWEEAQALPADFAPPIWDTLLLDADALWPDVDASIALANAALEVFSKWLLDEVAACNSLPQGLWEWINNRDQWLQEPSVDDRFGSLLKALAGRSLKEEPKLWEAYKELRQARNSFSHRGRPTVGKKRPVDVTPDKAAAGRLFPPAAPDL
jgi:hypothetical protein